MKNLLKYFVIIVALISVSISGKAQFHKANGEFFEWGGRYNYTTSLNELYTLDVWGYEGEFEAILSCTGGEYDYKLNCAVEFLDIDGEVMWKTMYIRYMSVADGDFIYDIDFEDIAQTTGSYPILCILSMIDNEIYTELLDLVVEGVESEKTLKNIFTKGVE